MNHHENTLERDIWQTIVIGGGQAGLATGYLLKQQKQDFVILDASANTGDSWRERWDSLCAFTPAWTNGLPGMPFPGPKDSFPSKDAIAVFLASYKNKFDLPVIYGARVTRLAKSNNYFEVVTGGKKYYSKSIVVATGNYAIPKIPAFASALNPSILQLHSSRYKSPAELPEGDVLVVGAGTSGLQIAMDLPDTRRKVYVAGTPPKRIPDFIFKYFAHSFVWFAGNILSVKTPIGRKARQAIRTKGKGAPLIHISLEEVERKGIIHVPRIVAAEGGWPVTREGNPIHVNTIIWANGFLPDYSWIQIPDVLDSSGYPATRRGISSSIDGLFFVGSLFQYALTSTWIGGVGKDADFIVGKIAAYNTRTETKTTKVPGKLQVELD